MYSVTFTALVNKHDDKIQLNEDQIYRGLKLKAKFPEKFLKGVTSNKVLEDNETNLVRYTAFDNGMGAWKEKAEYFPPSLLVFTPYHDSGEPKGTITNVISKNEEGDIFLTFTFALGPNGPLHEDDLAKKMRAGSVGAVTGTIAEIRRLVESGEL